MDIWPPGRLKTAVYNEGKVPFGIVDSVSCLARAAVQDETSSSRVNEQFARQIYALGS